MTGLALSGESASRIASDFKELLPTRKQAHGQPDDRPTEFLWVYDPQEAKVHIEAGENQDHPADFPTHKTLATHVHHPDRLEGYAYPIQGGYRIMDHEHHKVEDPFILKAVLAGLQKEHPVALPSIRYHGDPARADKH